MYRPILDSVAGSLTLTALIAMLPLLTLFILLGVMRMTALVFLQSTPVLSWMLP